MNRITIILLCCVILLSYDSSSYASVITAGSCSEQDVQSAIDSAANGDVIIIPAGQCTWLNTLKIPNVKGLTIAGAGVDSTLITDGTTTGTINGDTEPLITISLNEKNIDISGFSILNMAGFGISVSGIEKNANFRIHNINFTNGRGRCIEVNGWIYGLIDHCVLSDDYAPDSSVERMNFFDTGYSNDYYGEYEGDSMKMAPSLGGREAMYLEDNTFDCTAEGCDHMQIADSDSAGRYVVRHNTGYNVHMSVHDNNYNPGLEGGLQWEVYDNKFYSNSDGNHVDFLSGSGSNKAPLRMLAGYGIIYNNEWNDTATYAWTYGIHHHFARDCGGVGGSPWNVTCDGNSELDGNYAMDDWAGWDGGKAHGTHTGSNNQTNSLTDSTASWKTNEWVGYYVWNTATGKDTCRGEVTANTSNTLTISGLSCSDFDNGDGYKITNGWPCRLQFGSGPVTDGRWGDPQHQWGEWKNPKQSIQGVYSWNNFWGGDNAANHSNDPNLIFDANNSATCGITREGRDWFRPVANFDGSSGMGEGLIAKRPVNCTKGVGYFASDQETLYKCTSTNTWEKHWSPYIYPHPLNKEISPLLPAPFDIKITPK